MESWGSQHSSTPALRHSIIPPQCGAGEAIVIVRGQWQKQLLPGEFFVAGQPLEAQAAEFGGQSPTARSVLPAKASQAERGGFTQQGEDARAFPRETSRHRGGKIA